MVIQQILSLQPFTAFIPYTDTASGYLAFVKARGQQNPSVPVCPTSGSKTLLMQSMNTQSEHQRLLLLLLGVQIL